MSPLPPPPRPCILIAEDNPDDRLLLECAFVKAEVDAVLRFVTDGQEVVDYLQNQGAFADAATNPTPALILLDLQMPRMNGFEVLEWMNLQPQLASITVVVYSGTEQKSAMAQARALGARHYLIKPQSLHQLIVMARSLHTFLQVLGKSRCASHAVGC